MKILILGSGGRESAFAWKIAQSPNCEQLYIAPGNGGTQQYGENVDLKIGDFKAIKEFCLEKGITVVLPGGEDTLVAGIANFFNKDPQLRHILIVGPSAEGAQLEGSKAFAKQFMLRHGVPTASYKEFNADTFEEGLHYIENHDLPVVVKADGLAAGKGVIIAETTEQAKEAFKGMVKDAAFGTAGAKVVIESFLTGIELSVFVLTDGKNYVLLPEAKDYKRIGEGDSGLNTGGMGAVSPVPFADSSFMEKVKNRIIEPTIQGLAKDGIDYKGFIFFGLINVEGNPFVIEYNCRMGDPETEVVLPRIKNDLLALFDEMGKGELGRTDVEIEEDVAITVMMVSGGYPGDYEKGKAIIGIENVEESIVFHSGTKKSRNNIVTAGGRVLAITSLGKTVEEALKKSYSSIQHIDFDQKYFRKDIGFEFIKQEQQ